MKILYLHQYFATPEVNAGTRSYEVAKRLVATGHEVTFVTSSAYLPNDLQLSNGWNSIDLEGINLHVLHLSYSNHDSFIKRIVKFLQFSLQSTFKSLTVDADVVFATSTPLTIAIPGLVYSKIKRKPLVFEVRDLWPELPIAVGAIKNRFLINLAEWFEKYTYKNSKRLIGLSPGMCAGIIKHGVNNEHVFLATNSCDTSLFEVEKSIGVTYIHQKLPFLNGRKLVVYTGTFGLINKVGYLVELASKMQKIDSRICFVAIGDGMEKQAVIEFAKSSSVFEKNLFFLDPVPKLEIVSLLSAADFSLSLFGDVPQMWHNSANKLFDALASSTPVGINYGGWQKDFIEEYKCGLVLDSKDHTTSALNLSNFLSDETAYRSAVQNSYYLAHNKFSRDMMAEIVETALLEAVND